jgi:hypothetical protein
MEGESKAKWGGRKAVMRSVILRLHLQHKRTEFWTQYPVNSAANVSQEHELEKMVGSLL